MKVFTQSTFNRWPFENKSIQAIITSPPYYSLRKYDIPDIQIGEWKGQYGLEPTYQLYIEHTLLWCREAKRVLRDDGVMFLNLGDSYSGSGKAGNNPEYQAKHTEFGKPSNHKQRFGMPTTNTGLPPKCLLDIPFRVSIAIVDQLGMIKRNNIVWYSPNKMPESVTDRFSKKHEMIFMFSKSTRYYFDLDAVRENHKEDSLKRACRGNTSNAKYVGGDYSCKREREFIGYKDIQGKLKRGELEDCNPKGKNPGDTWLFNTQPSPEKHYAMWPEKLVERMILCSTKQGDTVLDPFCGSGTTLRVADKLNREAYGIDLGYQDIQARRLSNIQKVLL